MEYRYLRHEYVDSTAQCVREVISPLTFYNDVARIREMDKYRPDRLMSFVDDPTRCNIVAMENGAVVGFLFGVMDANVLFVAWIGMKEQYRRSHHMETLWNTMESWCRVRTVHKVWCDTNQLNVPAISFMHKMGLKKCGELTDCWYGHDYFLWEKQLHG